MKTVKTFSTLLFLVMSGLSVQAVAVELKAGKWGFRSESSGMMGSDGEEYSEQCMAEPFDPMGEMMDNDMASSCDVEVNTETDVSYDADLSCSTQAGPISGKFTVNVTDSGNVADGTIHMSMVLGDQTMTLVSARYEAQYLGACE